MFTTKVTRQWDLAYPLVCAPMLGVSGGALAAAVSQSGALGMIAVVPASDANWIEAQVKMIPDGVPYGVGMLAWDIARRPAVLEQVLAHKPYLVSISFGSAQPYAHFVHAAGARLTTQVNSVASGMEAEQFGADAVTVQGSEAGGHTGRVGLSALLQGLAGRLSVPLIAAGGIGTPQGIAAALMGGADAVWLGTRFLAATESLLPESIVQRVLEGQETSTVLTRLYDLAMQAPWPEQFPGRVMANRFTSEWLDTPLTGEALSRLHEGLARNDPEIVPAYAGESVRFVTQREHAADIVRTLMAEAEQWWTLRSQALTR